jgi:hypothetical protein
VCQPGAQAAPEPAVWLTEKKSWLKASRWSDVLDTLRPWREPDDVADEAAPVRASVRHISNRTGALDYHCTLAAELPIGSGEIESAHRYIIQSRFKRAGHLEEMDFAALAKFLTPRRQPVARPAIRGEHGLAALGWRT